MMLRYVDPHDLKLWLKLRSGEKKAHDNGSFVGGGGKEISLSR